MEMYSKEKKNTNQKKPLFSIIIPVFNEGSKLERAIDSALYQDDNNIEIIVVNDGSTDEHTLGIINEYRDMDYVRVLHKSNGGVSSARNKGIEEACGEYIIFLDADDWLEIDACSSYMKLINDNPGVDILFPNYYIDDEVGGEIYKEEVVKTDEKYINDSEGAILDVFSKTIYNNRGCFKRSTIINNSLRMREDLIVSEDLDFVLRAMFFSQYIVFTTIAKYHYCLYQKHGKLTIGRYESQVKASNEWINMLLRGGYSENISRHLCKLFADMMCVYFLMIENMNSKDRKTALQICKDSIGYLKYGSKKSRIIYVVSHIIGIKHAIAIFGYVFRLKNRNSVK